MLVPTLEALRNLGGSGTTDEIYDKVIDLMAIPNDVLEVPHGNTSINEVEYRLAWSRTYLKKYGLTDNSSRGISSLTPKGIDAKSIDPREIVRFVREAE